MPSRRACPGDRSGSTTWEPRSKAYDRRQEADKGARFTGLLHHIYAIERLEAAYYALKRDAAPGVDGQTWQSYGQVLQAALQTCPTVWPAGATGPSL